MSRLIPLLSSLLNALEWESIDDNHHITSTFRNHCWLVANWTAGIWDEKQCSLHHTDRSCRAASVSTSPAFRTCYGPRCLSAQGKSRDLRHFSPMPTRGGNNVLRDMAHMVIGPIDSTKFHPVFPFLRARKVLNCCVLLLCRSKRDSLMTSPVQKPLRGRTSFLNRSHRMDGIAFPQMVRLFLSQCISGSGPLSRGLVSSLT